MDEQGSAICLDPRLAVPSSLWLPLKADLSLGPRFVQWKAKMGKMVIVCVEVDLSALGRWDIPE